MVKYRGTMEFIIAAPTGWTISEVMQYVAEKAEAAAGQMSGTRGGFLVIDSVKVAGEADGS